MNPKRMRRKMSPKRMRRKMSPKRMRRKMTKRMIKRRNRMYHLVFFRAISFKTSNEKL